MHRSFIRSSSQNPPFLHVVATDNGGDDVVVVVVVVDDDYVDLTTLHGMHLHRDHYEYQ